MAQQQRNQLLAPELAQFIQSQQPESVLGVGVFLTTVSPDDSHTFDVHFQMDPIKTGDHQVVFRPQISSQIGDDNLVNAILAQAKAEVVRIVLDQPIVVIPWPAILDQEGLMFVELAGFAGELQESAQQAVTQLAPVAGVRTLNDWILQDLLQSIGGWLSEDQLIRYLADPSKLADDAGIEADTPEQRLIQMMFQLVFESVCSIPEVIGLVNGGNYLLPSRLQQMIDAAGGLHWELVGDRHHNQLSIKLRWKDLTISISQAADGSALLDQLRIIGDVAETNMLLVVYALAHARKRPVYFQWQEIPLLIHPDGKLAYSANRVDTNMVLYRLQDYLRLIRRDETLF